jgi:hypothetical protein
MRNPLNDFTLIPVVISEGSSDIQLLIYTRRKASGVLLRRNHEEFKQFVTLKSNHILHWLNSFRADYITRKRDGNSALFQFYIVNRSIDTDIPRDQWLLSAEGFPEQARQWLYHVEYAISDYGRMRIDGDIKLELTFWP